LQCVAVCCSVLQCVAVCCSVLQCVVRIVCGTKMIEVCVFSLRQLPSGIQSAQEWKNRTLVDHERSAISPFLGGYIMRCANCHEPLNLHRHHTDLNHLSICRCSIHIRCAIIIYEVCQLRRGTQHMSRTYRPQSSSYIYIGTYYIWGVPIATRHSTYIDNTQTSIILVYVDAHYIWGVPIATRPSTHVENIQTSIIVVYIYRR